MLLLMGARRVGAVEGEKTNEAPNEYWSAVSK
jgi:hypothetical protein